MTRDQIIDNLNFQKVELERALSKARAIQSEISDLETLLHDHDEPLNNPKACLHPIMFSQKKCDSCGFYGRCSYLGKSDYGRFRL